jgi:hypothetical protein
MLATAKLDGLQNVLRNWGLSSRVILEMNISMHSLQPWACLNTHIDLTRIVFSIPRSSVSCIVRSPGSRAHTYTGTVLISLYLQEPYGHRLWQCVVVTLCIELRVPYYLPLENFCYCLLWRPAEFIVLSSEHSLPLHFVLRLWYVGWFLYIRSFRKTGWEWSADLLLCATQCCFSAIGSSLDWW